MNYLTNKGALFEMVKKQEMHHYIFKIPWCERIHNKWVGIAYYAIVLFVRACVVTMPNSK